MAKRVKVQSSIESWSTRNGKSVRIVTRDTAGRFYDNISWNSLAK